MHMDRNIPGMRMNAEILTHSYWITQKKAIFTMKWNTQLYIITSKQNKEQN